MRLLFTLAMALGLLAAPPADAETRRYALLVGLDEVPDAGLPPLKHAEREVRALSDLLVRHGRFEAAGIEVLLGDAVTHSAVLSAFERIAARMRRDTRPGADDETLFFVVWSGHGNAGELLTRTAPLTSHTLWQQVSGLGATLQVGFFDACFSGSLTAKGVMDVTPFNPFAQLPDAPLGTRGSFNVSSSTGDQRSFEHPERGSLMMNALTRAFTEAAPARSAMALEQDMLPFIAREMSRLADGYGVEQTPQWKSDLVSTRPIFMSWPLERRASVALPEAAVDCVEVEYTDSGYVEQLRRAAPADRVGIYARPVRLRPCDTSGGGRRVDDVTAGDVIRFAGAADFGCRPWPGRCVALTDKSGGTRWLADDAVTAHVGAGVGYGWASDVPMAAARASVGGRLGWGRWAGGLDLGVGLDDGVTDGLAWSVVEGEARVMIDRTLWSHGPVELTAGAGPSLTFGRHAWRASRDGEAQTSWVHPGVVGLGRLWVPVPLATPWSYLALGAGLRWQERLTAYGDAAGRPETGWRVTPMVEVSAISRRWSL